MILVRLRLFGSVWTGRNWLHHPSFFRHIQVQKRELSRSTAGWMMLSSHIKDKIVRRRWVSVNTDYNQANVMQLCYSETSRHRFDSGIERIQLHLILQSRNACHDSMTCVYDRYIAIDVYEAVFRFIQSSSFSHNTYAFCLFTHPLLLGSRSMSNFHKNLARINRISA
jgi:hypothetical protein